MMSIRQMDSKKKKNGPRLTVNTYNTVYPIITDTCKALNLRSRLVDPQLHVNPYQMLDHQTPMPQPEDFDICWFDLAITPDILYRVKPYQRISQWPGIQIIAHKNKLGKNLMLMQREYPDDYNFFPKTFMLPYELADFRNEFQKFEEPSPSKKKGAKN